MRAAPLLARLIAWKPNNSTKHSPNPARPPTLHPKRTHSNDLVISGHGVVYAAVPLALGEFYPAGGPLSPAALAWAGVARLCVREVLDKTHYSVDMLLAVAVTALVWRARAGAMAGAAAPWRLRRRGAPADPVPRAAVALVGGVLVLVLVGVAGV